MKKIIKSLIPQKFHWLIYNKLKNMTSWRSRSYSSYGEDMVVSQLASLKKGGFYVDVGAFHPFKYSNTYYFYKYCNWTGINVEPNPESIHLFHKSRNRDINLNMGVAKQEATLNYYMFEDGLYNSFDEQRKDELLDHGMRLKGEKPVPVRPLAQIFDEHLKGKTVNFLNVDVEMLDLEVLESNNWQKYKPEVIAIEDHGFEIEKFADSKIYQLLAAQGYSLASQCHFTTIYKLK